MSQQPDVTVDVTAMPKLGRAPGTENQELTADQLRHASMADLGARTLRWNPEMADAMEHFSFYLRHSTVLPKRDREIAILRHAFKCGSDYQWGMHSVMA